MPDNTTKGSNETINSVQEDDEKQYHEEPATPVQPASGEVKPKPASESAKNSK